MIEKIKKIYQQPYVQLLRDMRVVGLLAFGIIALLVTWSGVQVINTNYALQQQIARLEEQNNVQELENNNQQLKNEYFKTDEYLELQARRQFGKAAPGEKLILVSKQAALARTIDLKTTKTSQDTAKPQKPAYQENFEAWMDFFFHRSS